MTPFVRKRILGGGLMKYVGKTFNFSETSTIGIIWAAIREHDEDPNWILLVPLDSYMIEGDLDIRTCTINTPRIARVGCTFWAKKEECDAAEELEPLGLTDINNINSRYDLIVRLNNVDNSWFARINSIVACGERIFTK